MKRKLRELYQYEWDLFVGLNAKDLANKIDDGEITPPRAYELLALRLWLAHVTEHKIFSGSEIVLAKVIQHLKEGGYRDDDNFEGLFDGY